MVASIQLQDGPHPPVRDAVTAVPKARLEEIVLSDEDLRLTRMFKALANPVRLAILRWLVEHPQCITGDIVEVAGLAQSTVSGHLAVLRDCGLVCGTIDGPATCYCVCLEALDWFEAQVGRLVTGVHACVLECERQGAR
jgi:ArsR family transcriptional regulator, arsenate/arsenite/antimonite-responsive transcriptional repressor